MDRIPTVERAFEIAKSGSCHTLSDVRRQLSVEGYADGAAQTAGPSIKRQLQALIAAARREAP